MRIQFCEFSCISCFLWLVFGVHFCIDFFSLFSIDYYYITECHFSNWTKSFFFFGSVQFYPCLSVFCSISLLYNHHYPNAHNERTSGRAWDCITYKKYDWTKCVSTSSGLSLNINIWCVFLCNHIKNSLCFASISISILCVIQFFSGLFLAVHISFFNLCKKANLMESVFEWNATSFLYQNHAHCTWYERVQRVYVSAHVYTLRRPDHDSFNSLIFTSFFIGQSAAWENETLNKNYSKPILECYLSAFKHDTKVIRLEKRKYLYWVCRTLRASLWNWWLIRDHCRKSQYKPVVAHKTNAISLCGCCAAFSPSIFNALFTWEMWLTIQSKAKQSNAMSWCFWQEKWSSIKSASWKYVR